MAVMAALDFVLQNPVFQDRVSVVSFGEPRSGNLQWAKLALKYLPNHYRIVHQNDIVPTLPPRFLGYFHSGQETQLTGTDKDTFQLVLCDQDLDKETGESPSCGKTMEEEAKIFTLTKKTRLGFGQIIKGLIDGADDIVFGFVTHITQYFSFFTYPPIPVITTKC